MEGRGAPPIASTTPISITGRQTTNVRGRFPTSGTQRTTTVPIDLPPIQTVAQGSGPSRPLTSGCRSRYGVSISVQEAGTLTEERTKDIVEQMREASERFPELIAVSANINVYSFEEMMKMKVCIVDHVGDPIYGSLDDTKMGEVGNLRKCKTCYAKNCAGHYGLIKFDEPIYNPQFLRIIFMVLNVVCNDCFRLLLPESMIKSLGFDKYSGVARLELMEKYIVNTNTTSIVCVKSAEEAAGKEHIRTCNPNPYYLYTDSEIHGRIIYQPSKQDKTRSVRPIRRRNRERPRSPQEPISVEDILQQISEEDAVSMGFMPGCSPSRLIMYGMLVIPPELRAPTYDNGKIRPHPLTAIYTEIINASNGVRTEVNAVKSGKSRTDEALITATIKLYTSVKKFLYGTGSETPVIAGGEQGNITALIQGKTKHIRKAMMGKRGDYCARTVLGPDASLKFGQIRVPMVFAPILTIPVNINQYNIEAMKKLLSQGKITHIKRRGIRIVVRPDVEYGLQIGERVYRHLQNGDRVIFNRQPTLQKQSLMSYEVVLGKELTFGHHPSATFPHGMD